MAISVQDQIADAIQRHSVGVQRVAARTRNLVLKVLDDSEPALRMRILDKLRKHTGGFSIQNEMRIQSLFRSVRKIRGRAFKKAWPLLRDELASIAAAEPRFMEGILRTVSPTKLGKMNIPSGRGLQALANKRPFQGRVLRQWASQIRQGDLRRIQDQIRIGLAQGEKAVQVARRITGTVALRGANGVTQITRAQATTLTKTAATHYSNTSRRQFFLENPDLVKEEMFVAELDRRTTETCFSLHGEIRKVNVLPLPPLHFRCRSDITAVANREAMNKPGKMKPKTEQLLMRQFTKDSGLSDITRRAQLPHGFKGRFDAFSKSRMNQLIGRAPTTTGTGIDFLNRQSFASLKATFGPVRAKLFRDGGITPRQFIKNLGDAPMPLSQLSRLHADSFRAAGFDPADFF